MQSLPAASIQSQPWRDIAFPAFLPLLLVLLSSTSLFASARLAGKKTAVPVARWGAAQPGCTFTTTPDGKYNYGLWSGDLGVTVSVDAREVQIIRHRIEPIFGLFVTIRYRGQSSLDFPGQHITLQFMKHFKWVQPALDPDAYVEKIQKDADELDDETRRIVQKHPEKERTRKSREQDYQKSIAEFIEFLNRNSLRPALLDPAHPQISGWISFDTANKWLTGWKAQEEFVLRLPLDGKIFEFPFKLPPQKGELLMRKRE